MERELEPGYGYEQVSLVRITNDAGWPTGAWDNPAHEQPRWHSRAGYHRPERNGTRPRYQGQQERGGLVAPILVLPRQRDVRYPQRNKYLYGGALSP